MKCAYFPHSLRILPAQFSHDGLHDRRMRNCILIIMNGLFIKIKHCSPRAELHLIFTWISNKRTCDTFQQQISKRTTRSSIKITISTVTWISNKQKYIRYIYHWRKSRGDGGMYSPPPTILGGGWPVQISPPPPPPFEDY